MAADMDAQQRGAPAAATARGGKNAHSTPANSSPTRRRPPAYARQFEADSGHARVIVGWPQFVPPPNDWLVLPPDTQPSTVDWGLLAGAHVFISPAGNGRADRALLRSLCVELARAGVASALAFDGECVTVEYWRKPVERPGAPR